MDRHTTEDIHLEIATLVRYVAAITSGTRDGGLDRSGFLLLHQISRNGAAGVKALAAEFQLDISTVSRQTATLESKGCIYKVPDPADGRAYTYQISDFGKEELAAYRQEKVTKLEKHLSGWTEQERQTFAQLLHKYNQSFR